MATSSGYDFSQLYHSSIVAFSPGTTFLATAHHGRIVVRSSATLAIVRTWLCSPQIPPLAASSSMHKADSNEVGAIDQLLWSADSLYLLAFSSGAKTAWVFGLADEGDGESGEIARLGGEGVEGLVRVEWSKIGRDVLAWSDFGLRLTVFSLSTGSARMIQFPKSHLNCHTYSPDGRYLAVAERHGGKEHVGVYDVLDTFQLVRHFPLRTTDVQGISWSPSCKWIAAWDSPLAYSLHIHSPIGAHITHFSPASSTFSSASSSEDPGLGIKTVAWAPGGRFIAIGGWDGKVRVIESEGWRCISVMGWGTRTADKAVTVCREPSDWLRDTRGRGIVQFDRSPLPAILPTVRPDYTKFPARAGISQLAFDAEATLLLVRLETSPDVLHIVTFLPTPSASSPEITHLASAIFTHPVKTAKWSPTGSKRLAVTTRCSAVYFWDCESPWVEERGEDVRGGMMEGVGIPSHVDFSAHDILWSTDGASLAIQDKSQFCILYEATSEDQRGSNRWDGVEGLTHVSEEEEHEESFTDSVGADVFSGGWNDAEGGTLGVGVRA